MSDTQANKAFILRFSPEKGFEVDSVGEKLSNQEILAMTDAFTRQAFHSRLSLLEEAIRLHSEYLKQLLTLLKPLELETDGEASVSE